MNPTQVRAIGRPILLLVFACSLVSVASAEWDEKVLYSFQGVPDGSVPAGGVVFDKTGNLYGATQGGGSSSCDGPGQCGTVYQLTPPTKKGGAWTETVLYVFKGHAYKDGATPEGGVVMDQAGNLYGTTGYGGSGPCTLLGGAVGCGTVYEISPPAKQGDPWTETVLYSFQGGKDGYVASGDLVFDKAGNLYGATLFGGGKGTTCDSLYGGQCGTVFKVSPSKTKGGKWTEKVLHQFSGGTDGANPNGGLVLDSKRAVYGTTPIGGNQLCNFGNGNVGCGITFRLSAPTTKGGGWTEDVVHRFTEKDGASPNGGLIFDAKGGLYGTTGGAAGARTKA
ncbi:MAG: choice-of-anchor tandem repeat GloVer-containing protein [Terriglobales bacterium]